MNQKCLGICFCNKIYVPGLNKKSWLTWCVNGVPRYWDVEFCIQDVDWWKVCRDPWSPHLWSIEILFYVVWLALFQAKAEIHSRAQAALIPGITRAWSVNVVWWHREDLTRESQLREEGAGDQKELLTYFRTERPPTFLNLWLSGWTQVLPWWHLTSHRHKVSGLMN